MPYQILVHFAAIWFGFLMPNSNYSQQDPSVTPSLEHPSQQKNVPSPYGNYPDTSHNANL